MLLYEQIRNSKYWQKTQNFPRPQKDKLSSSHNVVRNELELKHVIHVHDVIFFLVRRRHIYIRKVRKCTTSLLQFHLLIIKKLTEKLICPTLLRNGRRSCGLGCGRCYRGSVWGCSRRLIFRASKPWKEASLFRWFIFFLFFYNNWNCAKKEKYINVSTMLFGNKKWKRREFSMM